MTWMSLLSVYHWRGYPLLPLSAQLNRHRFQAQYDLHYGDGLPSSQWYYI